MATEHRAMVLALHWTETSWRKGINHNEPYSEGDCGIRRNMHSIFEDMPEDLHKNLLGCWLLWESELYRHNGVVFNTLKHWKGAKRNFYGVYKTLDVHKIIAKHLVKWED